MEVTSLNDCKVCGKEVSTKEELQLHRKEAHGLITPVGRSSLGSSIASLALRGFLGTVMIMHGVPSLTEKREEMIQEMEKHGVPKEATVSGALLEVAGGAAILAGFLVPVVSSLLAAEMVSTSVLSKKKMGKQFLSDGKSPSYELDVVYALGFGILAIIGGGEFSVDRLLKL